MPNAIVLNASVYKVTTDRDGEAKIIFCIPLSDIDAAAQVSKLVEKLLKLTVEVQPT